MPKRGNISLSSYDDIFRTDESRAEEALEKVQPVAIDKLVPFKNHPFKVVDDEAMLRTTESIAQYGVLTPLIARPLENGTFEIISGHRRAHAALAAGLTEVPVLVRQMDDDHVKQRVILVFHEKGGLPREIFRELDAQQRTLVDSAVLSASRIGIRIPFLVELVVAIDLFHGAVCVENHHSAVEILV